MKKLKSICLLLICFTMLFLVACQSEDTSITFDQVSPFGGNDYEYIEYSVQKKDIVVSQTGERAEAIIAEGTLKFTLELGQESKTSLDMEFELTYNNLAPDINKGKTDTIVTNATFSRASMSPLTSCRSVKIAPRGDTDPSYKIEADYNAKSATMTKYKNGQQITTDLQLKPNSNTYDNEYLFYLVRSSSKLNPSGHFDFNLSVLYDSFANGSFITHQMTATTASQITYVTVGENVGNDIEGITNEKGENNINALQVNIGMGHSVNRGPDIVTMYSMDKFYIDGKNVYVADDKKDPSHKEMSKVMLQMSTTEYEGNIQKYITTYTMSKYSINKDNGL